MYIFLLQICKLDEWDVLAKPSNKLIKSLWGLVYNNSIVYNISIMVLIDRWHPILQM